MKKSAVVVFPGRGAYGKDELGYLARHHADKAGFIADVDAWRKSQGREPVSALDGTKTYSAAKHASSINASALIYTCALADFAAIDRERYDVVGVCGNSLGWYLTLAAARAVDERNAVRLVDTMGALMEEKGIGGQVIYPFVDEDWRASRTLEKAVGDAVHDGRTEGEAYLSIRLGGMAVLAGDEKGLAAMEKALPKTQDRYPFRLARHAAFHTPLLSHVSDAAFEALEEEIFEAPALPMIDGRGVVWTRFATDPSALYQYTFGHQIVETYDFSKSVEVAVKEFAPDVLILAGPGSTLGAPIAQELIRHRWLGFESKADFIARQKDEPFLLALGREEQRELVV